MSLALLARWAFLRYPFGRNGADRKKISLTSTSGTKWDDNWHTVKILRKPSDGAIEIYFDDMQKPVMTASDKTFAYGRIGLGTFDDTAEWDDITIRGVIAGGNN
jgi:hypothetical protein